MKWLKGNWFKVLLVVFAVGGWVTRQEIDAMEGKGHRQMVCYEECLKHCKAWCELQNLVEDSCNCPMLCEERCG